MQLVQFEKIAWIILGVIEGIFLFLQFSYGNTLPIWNLIFAALVAYAIYNKFKGKPVSDSERSSELGITGILAIMGIVNMVNGAREGYLFLNFISTVLSIALAVIGFQSIGKGKK